MKWMYIKLLGLILICTLPLACAQQQESLDTEELQDNISNVDTAPKVSSKLSAPLFQISNFIKLECQHDKQCKTIGIGASPCGGSPKHLVYSTLSSNVSKLLQTVKSYNDKQRQEFAKKGLVGTCQYISAPKTYCSKHLHKCLAQSEPESDL